MAIAPGMDFSLQRKVLPDASGVVDILFQLLASTASAISADSLSVAVLFVVAFWALFRYLFHKPAHSGVGEYLLCLFLRG